jgi:hypothetical protein
MLKRLLSPLRYLATHHPYACATVMFIAVMTFVKLGATKIVDGYGLAGTLVTIGAIYVFAVIIDRR